MKEKRVDILLSVLSLLHLMFLGVSGSFAVEFMGDHPRENILFLTSLSTVIVMIVGVYLALNYDRFFGKKKTKSHG